MSTITYCHTFGFISIAGGLKDWNDISVIPLLLLQMKVELDTSPCWVSWVTIVSLMTSLTCLRSVQDWVGLRVGQEPQPASITEARLMISSHTGIWTTESEKSSQPGEQSQWSVDTYSVQRAGADL